MVPPGFRLRMKFLSRISFVLVCRASQEKLARFIVFLISGQRYFTILSGFRRQIEELHETLRTEVGNNDRISERPKNY